MAINFPTSPSTNDTFTAGSITYKWDGAKWIGLGVTPTDRLVEGSNKLEITAGNDLVWTGDKVGIGEETPDSKLDIVYSSSTPITSTENLIHLRTDPSGSYASRGLFVKIGRDGAYDNSTVHYDIVGSAGNSGTHIFEVQGGEKLRITTAGAVVPGANVTQPLGTNTLRWQNVYAQSYRFNDNGRIDYNTTANTMEFVIGGNQAAEFTSGSFVPVSSAANVAIGTTAKRWGSIRGQALDINGATNAVMIEHTGGSGLNIKRSSKDLSFNANYSAANTHASIELTSGMDLGFYLGGSERVRFESNGEVRFTGQVRLTEERPFLRLISSAPTSNTDPRAIINFESQNSDNDEDMYRINFWEGNSSGETNAANASIRYNGSTSDGGDGSIRFCNENSDRLFSVNRLGGGNILGTLAQNSSDIRLKENITPIENALEKVNSLSGFTYTWNQEAQDAGLKGDEHDCVQVGVSAQDVQEVQPEAVKPSPVDREKYITVQYEKLVPLLIEAIKELKEENETLKERLDAAGL
jgi:hypothetical protein